MSFLLSHIGHILYIFSTALLGFDNSDYHLVFIYSQAIEWSDIKTHVCLFF